MLYTHDSLGREVYLLSWMAFKTSQRTVCTLCDGQNTGALAVEIVNIPLLDYGPLVLNGSQRVYWRCIRKRTAMKPAFNLPVCKLHRKISYLLTTQMTVHEGWPGVEESIEIEGRDGPFSTILTRWRRICLLETYCRSAELKNHIYCFTGVGLSTEMRGPNQHILHQTDFVGPNGPWIHLPLSICARVVFKIARMANSFFAVQSQGPRWVFLRRQWRITATRVWSLCAASYLYKPLHWRAPYFFGWRRSGSLETKLQLPGK